MSQYSQYQVTHYRTLFLKHASDPSRRLALHDLRDIMVQFGLVISTTALKDLMYQYDSHRKGRLDLTDWLLLLQDYEACFDDTKKRVEAAFSYFQRKTHSSGVTKNDMRYILQMGESALPPDQIREALQDYLGDARPEATLKMSDFTSKNFGTSLAWCDHQAYSRSEHTSAIMRDIVIKNLVVGDLRPFARTKLRKGRKIEYFTLDPFITIECAGISQETTILVGEVQPSWNQDILLQIKFPVTTDFFELQRWIEGQRLVFHLYDYIASGTVPYKEWIASGYLPLSTVLESASNGHVLVASVEMKTPSIPCSSVVLEVSAVVSADRLTPYFELPEEMWVSKYHPKMRQDLQYGLRPNDDAEKVRDNGIIAGNASHAFWDYYYEFYQHLKSKFRRRHFQLVGLNEYNQFWCLTSFLRPLYANNALNTPELLAENVARIETNKLIPNTGFHSHTVQVSSPAAVLFRKSGSAVEHAILLCDLFLGLGMNAYVCIGTYQSERTAWVITFNDPHLSRSSSNPSSDLFEQGPITDSSYNTAHIPIHGLARSRSIKSRINNDKLVRSASGNNRNAPLRELSEIIISPPASDDESDDGGYDEAIAFAKQNLTRKVDTNSVDLAVGQDVFSLIENLSKKKYTKKKKTKAAANHTVNVQKNMHDKVKEKSKAVTLLQQVVSSSKEKMHQVLTNKHYSRDNNLTSSLLAYDESKFPSPILPAKNVTLWDPTTGKSYKYSDQAHLPFDVGCIFNTHNVWINIQKYEQVSRIKWEIDKINDWFPFLDEDIKDNCGPIQCWYSEPTQLSDILQEEPDATNKMVTELGTLLQGYRINKLGLSDSAFFTPLCKILQEATKQFEQQLQKKESRMQDIITKVEAEILAVLPDHYYWCGKPYHFYHANVDEIFQQIEWTGILNCSIPQALYAIAANVFDYPWGLKSVWVYVGYTADLFYNV